MAQAWDFLDPDMLWWRPADPLLATDIRDVEWTGQSVRIRQCLLNSNILTLGELVERDRFEIMRIPNFGKTSLYAMEETLWALGLRLAPDKL